jgi:chromosome segregation ATPase
MDELKTSWQATEEGKYFTPHASLGIVAHSFALPPFITFLTFHPFRHAGMRADLERLSTQLSEERARLEQELTRSHEAAAATLDGHVRELADARGQYDALVKQQADLSQDMATLQQQLKTANTALKDAHLQNTALKNSMGSLDGPTTTVEMLLKEKSSVQLKLDAVLERVRDLKAENAALKASVAPLEGAVAAAEALRVELRQQQELTLATEAAAQLAKTEAAEYIRAESERSSSESRASRRESEARERALSNDVQRVTLCR